MMQQIFLQKIKMNLDIKTAQNLKYTSTKVCTTSWPWKNFLINNLASAKTNTQEDNYTQNENGTSLATWSTITKAEDKTIRP